MPQPNNVNNAELFSHELVAGQKYVDRQQTIDTTVPLPHGGIPSSHSVTVRSKYDRYRLHFQNYISYQPMLVLDTRLVF